MIIYQPQNKVLIFVKPSRGGYSTCVGVSTKQMLCVEW